MEAKAVAASAGGKADEPARRARRLRIARLFTLSTPHQGAVLAVLPTFHKLHLQMRHGSQFLCDLDDCEKDAAYPIYPYVRLYDGWVGESNAAPAGRTAWWVPTPPFQGAHSGVVTDPRIIADIGRRLRGEAPFTQDPPAPLPD
jgi:hypothetical protein